MINTYLDPLAIRLCPVRNESDTHPGEGRTGTEADHLTTTRANGSRGDSIPRRPRPRNSRGSIGTPCVKRDHGRGEPAIKAISRADSRADGHHAGFDSPPPTKQQKGGKYEALFLPTAFGPPDEGGNRR